jgi:hypothetical protein
MSTTSAPASASSSGASGSISAGSGNLKVNINLPRLLFQVLARRMQLLTLACALFESESYSRLNLWIQLSIACSLTIIYPVCVSVYLAYRLSESSSQ